MLSCAAEHHHLSPMCLRPSHTVSHPDTETNEAMLSHPEEWDRLVPVAWKTHLKRAGTILTLTGVCLLLKSPNLATAREVIERRDQGSAFGTGMGTNHWVSQTCRDSWSRSCLPSVWGFICQEMGKWPGPSQVKGCTSLQHAANQIS